MLTIKKRVITDLAGTSAYLIRWSLPLPFGWSLKIHRIVRPDDDRCTHNHPWSFLRIVLYGGYWELAGEDNRLVHIKPWRPWAPWRVYWCPTNFRHRIISLPRGESWTLVLVGRKCREWGFYTRAGWVAWKTFVNAARSARVLWCDDDREIQLNSNPAAGRER